MTIDNEKLKPCPFCGGRVQLEEVKMRSGTWYGVKCRNTRNLGGDCTMEQVPSRTPEAAAGRWNMRKPMEALIAENERFDEGMRSIASSLGAGGYNAEHLSAAELVDKVRWGVDHLCDTHERRITELKAEIEALRKLKLPHYLKLSDEMRAAGDHAEQRALEDQCYSVPVLKAVFFEAAIQRWLDDQEEAIDAAMAKEAGQ